MTASQRLRLVVALGAVNLVLAIVAFGLAGSSNVPPQTADRTPAPSATAGPVAARSPKPSAPAPKPTKPPVQPSTAPSSEPSASPAAPEATTAPAPRKTQGPVAVVVPTPKPTAAPVEPPTPAPASHDLRPVPPCPGSTTVAPGHDKQQVEPGRPCKGGEKAGSSASGKDRQTRVSAAHERLDRTAFEAPVGRLTDRVRPTTRRRIRRGPRLAIA